MVIESAAPAVGEAPVSLYQRLAWYAGPSTVVPPLGVAQVASPLQNVVEEAPVPEFRLPTGRLPVTLADAAVKDTGLVSNPPEAFVLIPTAVMTPVPVVVVAGAVPAPPPITRALAVRSALAERTVVLLK